MGRASGDDLPIPVPWVQFLDTRTPVDRHKLDDYMPALRA